MGDGPKIADLKPTFAEDMKREADLLRRRFVHHTRPKGPMSMEEAMELCRRMSAPGQGAGNP